MDRWVKSAMADHTIVADLLLRLMNSSVSTKWPPPPTLFSEWGAKQTRSSAPVGRRRKVKDEGFFRFSPTTPLSWTGSGGDSSSPSAADGCEESSRNNRSKDTASGEDSTNKCKRKKTFVELIQEESTLLKETIYLSEDIENKKVTFQARRASNESLNRRKLDLGSISSDKPNSSAEEEHMSTLLDQHEPGIVPSTSRAVINANEDDTHPKVARILIPDLNMMPSEEEDDSYAADIPCGMS